MQNMTAGFRSPATRRGNGRSSLDEKYMISPYWRSKIREGRSPFPAVRKGGGTVESLSDTKSF